MERENPDGSKTPLTMPNHPKIKASTLRTRAVGGKILLRFEGAIATDDLQLMSKAIEEGCEKVDISEW